MADCIGWCVRNFMLTVSIIAPINTDSNVESTDGINSQSALDKEVSDDESVDVRAQIGWGEQVFS